MIPAVNIRFRNFKPTLQAAEWVREAVADLEKFFGGILSCGVLIERPHRHRAHGNPCHVRIDLNVPGQEIVIKHQPSLYGAMRHAGEQKKTKRLDLEAREKDFREVLNAAFQAAGRRLQDYVRKRRGYVKTHEALPQARVSQVFPELGYGFLETPEGREIYFHKNSLVHADLATLPTGTLVRFAEEAGEKGPQASSVVPVHSRRTRRELDAVGARS